jgi:hypothetical protein
MVSPQFSVIGQPNGSDIYRSSGNVGIGTATPRQKLEVANGHIAIVTNTYKSGADDDQLAGKIDFHLGGNSGELATPVAAIEAYDKWMGGSYFGALAFKVMGTERMRIDPSGNVGIGTTSPGTKLNMKGGVFLAENQASTNNQILYSDGGGTGGNNNSYTIANEKFGTGVFVNDTGTTGSTITLVNKESASNTTKHASIGFVNTDTTANGKFGGQIGFWPEDSNASKQQFRIYTSGARRVIIYPYSEWS